MLNLFICLLQLIIIMIMIVKMINIIIIIIILSIRFLTIVSVLKEKEAYVIASFRLVLNKANA